MSSKREKKITDLDYEASKATRLTFRLDPETVTKFKAIAAMKKMTIEELGLLTLKRLFKKEKAAMRRRSSVI